MRRTTIILIIICLLLIYIISLPTVKEHFLISKIKEQIAVIDDKLKDLDIREASSSYTEDKTTIYLCLRDERNNFYPMNTLIYVTLHEIAHLLNKQDFGHTEAFYKIFDKLLCDAASQGIYDPTKPHDSWYCGVDISNITMPTCSLDSL